MNHYKALNFDPLQRKMTLNQCEKDFFDFLKQGETIPFSPKGQYDKIIRADLLYCLYNSISISDGANFYPARYFTEINLSNMKIVGYLNLQNIYGFSNGYAPPLKFDKCTFDSEINLSNSHFASLTLKDCSFNKLIANEMHLEGSLHLANSEITNLETEKEDDDTQIIMRLAKIHGDIVAEKFTLKNRLNNNFQSYTEPQYSDYVWDMRGISVDGRILVNACNFTGGISLQDAKVHGDVWLTDTDISASKDHENEEMPAINGQSTLIGGHFICINKEKNLSIKGTIKFLNAEISQLVIENIEVQRLSDEPYIKIWNSNINNIVFKDIKIFGTLEIYESTIRGKVDIQNLTILKAIYLTGSIVSHDVDLGIEESEDTDLIMDSLQANTVKIEAKSIRSMQCKNAQIRGDLILKTTYLNGSSSFMDSTIKGKFEVNRVLIGKHGYIFSKEGKPRRMKKYISLIKSFFHKNHKFTSIDKELSFYPDYTWKQIIQRNKEKESSLSLLYMNKATDDPTILTGESNIIHKINADLKLKLTTEEKVADYVRFFCANVWGDEGPFIVVESLDFKNLSDDDIKHIREFDNKKKLDSGNEQSTESENQPKNTNSKGQKSDEELVKDIFKPVSVNKEGNEFKAEAVIRYGDVFFKSVFEIKDDGVIEMVDDTPILPRKSLIVEMSSPFITVDKNEAELIKLWNKDDDKRIQNEKENNKIKKIIKENSKKLVVDLRGLKVGVLEDNHGDYWKGDFQLKLFGFNFESIDERKQQVPSPQSRHDGLTKSTKNIFQEDDKDQAEEKGPSYRSKFKGWFKAILNSILKDQEWLSREKWLNRQFLDEKNPQKNEYSPFTYLRLARVYAARSEYEVAKQAQYSKLKLDTKFDKNFIRKPFKIFFGVFFGFGLKPSRALLFLLTYWLLGYLGVHLLNDNGYLVKKVNTANLSKVPEKSNKSKMISTQVACGNEINSAIYALDLFIPLIDLHQESRCRIKLTERKYEKYENQNIILRSVFQIRDRVLVIPDWNSIYQLLKAIYAIFGWVFTSIAIITFSGMMKRSMNE